MPGPQTDALTFRSVPGPVASIAQLAEPGGDTRQAAEDPPHRVSPVRSWPGGKGMQSKRFVRSPEQGGQIVFVIDLEASLLEHRLGRALDELLRRADGQGRIRLINANALKPGQVFSDRCWISQVSDQILSDLKACIGLCLVEMPLSAKLS